MTENTGRRARNMEQKRERIFAAAAALLAERGFAAVTTQAVSEAADVAAGTLFRYASTKAELLLMVLNEQFAAAGVVGSQRAAKESDPAKAIIQLMAPALELARNHPENAAAYQRELLFGGPQEQHRREGLALTGELERRMAEILIGALTDEAGGTGAAASQSVIDSARCAASTIFGAMTLAIARASTGAHQGHDAEADLCTQVTQIFAGFLATADRGAGA